MDPMEFSIELPPIISECRVGQEWCDMKQRLVSHLQHGSELGRPNPNLVLAFLINIASEHVQQVFNSFGLSFEEILKFSKVLLTLEEVCLPRLLIMYNRYRFFTCKQNVGTKFEQFFQDLLSWSENCEFGDLRDILLKDCIISGIVEDSLRQHLLRTEGLDLEKTLTICEAMNQGQFFTDTAVNTVSDDPLFMINVCVDTEDLDQFSHQECRESRTNQLVDASTEISSDFLLNDTNVGSQETKCPSPSDLYDSSLILQGQECTDNISFHDQNQKGNESSEIFELNQAFRSESISSVNKDNGCMFEISNNDEQTILGLVPDTDANVKNVSWEGEQEILNQEQNDSDSSMLKCPFCSLHIKNSKLARVHVHDNHRKSFHFCKKCKRIFEDAKALSEHRLNHANEKKFKCDQCVASFRNKHHFEAHLRLHTGEQPFTCDICEASFNEASKLKAHKRNHSGERPYSCEVCGRTFAWSAALKRHKRTHTGEQPYTCEVCGQSFADYGSAQRHRRRHTNERPYACGSCQATFMDSSSLKVHQRVHSGERPYCCPLCSSTFSRAHHLKEHLKIHSGSKPFSCDKCGAKFPDACKLKSHDRKHTGEKPFQCKECGMAFAWSAAFRRHMKRHTKEKPYFCDFCPSSFADHASLTRHRRTHTGERPYVCTVCGAAFGDNSSLNRHLRIHSGEKAYICDVCAASFSTKSYLDRHIRTHIGLKPHACSLCSAKFSDRSKLKRHQKTHAKSGAKTTTLIPSLPPVQNPTGLSLSQEKVNPSNHPFHPVVKQATISDHRPLEEKTCLQTDTACYDTPIPYHPIPTELTSVSSLHVASLDGRTLPYDYMSCQGEYAAPSNHLQSFPTTSHTSLSRHPDIDPLDYQVAEGCTMTLDQTDTYDSSCTNLGAQSVLAMSNDFSSL